MPLIPVATVTVTTFDGQYSREFTVGDWEPEHRPYHLKDAHDWASWISEDPDVLRATIVVH